MPPRGIAPPAAQASPTGERQLDRVLTKAMQLHASDVHIHTGLPIQMRVGGRLLKSSGAPMEPAQAEALILEILTESERAHFTAHNDLDFAQLRAKTFWIPVRATATSAILRRKVSMW
jgi:twitching motility protein PilT